MTSHQVVGRVRTLLNERRVGHGGTLDPLAEGVLPICVGRATRLAEWIAGGDKTYYAEVQLGLITATDDLEGATLAERPVPSLDEAQLARLFGGFVGRIEQLPPAFSAIKTRGVPAYRRARRGETVELRPRQIEIRRIDLVACDESSLSIIVRCGKGTYIRALARDLGAAIGCGGTLRRLIRLRVGGFSLTDATSLDELQAAAEQSLLEPLMYPLDAVLDTLPAVVLDEPRRQAACVGQAWPAARHVTGWVRAYDREGIFVGLIQAEPAVSEEEGMWSWRLRRLLTDG